VFPLSPVTTYNTGTFFCSRQAYCSVHLKVQTSVEVVVACFVMHNMCIRNGDRQIMEQTTADQPVDQDVPVRNFNGHGRPGAMAHRDAVICGHFAQQRLSLEHVCNKRY